MRRLLAALVLMGCGRIGFDPPPGPAWSFQLPLVVRDTARSEEIDAPILVVLTPDRVDYSLLATDGRDLRFVRNGATLAHEIERWDPAGSSFIWVLVPSLAIGDDGLVAVFGNPVAEDTQDAAAVWSSYAGVWHFAQDPAVDARLFDATANRNDGSFRGTPAAAAGIAGGGLAFDGDDFIEIVDADSLDVVPFTLEGWVGLEATASFHAILSKDGVGSDTTGAYNVFAGSDRSMVYETNNLNVPLTNLRACCLASSDLHYWGFTMASDGTAIVYLDGANLGTALQEVPRINNDNLLLGRRGIADSLMIGRLDEFRIAAAPHPATYFSVQHASVTDTLLDYGATEPR